MSEDLRLLLDLASDLPDGLRADWDGTNHYELTAPTDEYWWLTPDDIVDTLLDFDNKTTRQSERLGLLMDIAAVLKAAEPELKALLNDD